MTEQGPETDLWVVYQGKNGATYEIRLSEDATAGDSKQALDIALTDVDCNWLGVVARGGVEHNINPNLVMDIWLAERPRSNIQDMYPPRPPYPSGGLAPYPAPGN